MPWRFLGPLLALLLLGALALSRWLVSAPGLAHAPADDAPGGVAAAPPPRPAAAPAPPAPPPVPLAPAPAPTPSAVSGDSAAPREEDPGHGAFAEPASDEALEPEDGGVLHPLGRDGIREAVRQAQPELKECYEAWLQQSPALGGRVKVIFTIAAVPGHARGRVMDVRTPPDAGVGHLAFEGCVRNVFRGLRFEQPEGGRELHVTWPLTFTPEKQAGPQ